MRNKPSVVRTVDQGTLQQAWDEIAYRNDVRHVTKGAHNERLWLDYWETVYSRFGFICITILLFVRSSRLKRKITELCRKQTLIPACLSDLSALWKYAWRTKPVVPLIYIKFLRRCTEWTTILIRKRMYRVLCRVIVIKKRVMCGKNGYLHKV